MSEMNNNVLENTMAKKVSAKNFAIGLKRLTDLRTDTDNKDDMVSKYVTTHINKKYISYAQKCDMARRIINATCYIDAERFGENKKVFSMNSPARYMLFCLSVIDAYTDIEIDFEHSVESFDALSENGGVDIIFHFIPEKEVDMISTILDMCLSDELENERNIVSTIDNIKIAISTFAGKFIEGFMEAIEEDPNGFSEIIDKLANLTGTNKE